MHFAAKADKAFALTFLYKRGVNPDCIDNEGLTPLHWACYMASDEAIYYLLAWTKALNQKDNNGKIPMHYAVESSQKYSMLRSLKEMLIKGSQRNIKDN